MLVGIVFSRRAERAYFVVLGLVALWLAFAEYAPLVNLHQVLWAVPGFSYLRAPGRFSYLVVFASACLAAFGLQTLEQRRQRLKVALTGALSTLALLVGLLALLSFGRAWLLADPARAISWVEATYLAQRAQYPIDPPLVLSGLLTSLEVTTVKTGWSLALLAVTAAGFAAWYLLGFARHLLGQAIFVTLLAVDLLIFAGDFHPRIPLDRLRPELAAAAPGQRVLMHDSADLPAFEPDQLLASGIEGADGYSSLPSQRHLEMQADTSLDPRLFDLWSAPLILEPARPADMHVVNGVPFRADHPLMAGFGGSPSQVFNMPSGITSLATLRVIGTLSYAFDVPQGQMVATLAVGGQTMPIRAGVELAERAYDRPSLAGLVQHQKARAAFDFEESTPEGEDYTAHLYEADFELAPSPAASSLSITPTNPAVEVQVYGLAAIDAGGAAHPLDLASRDGLQRIDERSIADTRALPRAFVLPTAQAFSPARHPGLTATQLVASPDMDPRTMVLIENDPNAPEAPSGSQPVVPATRVDDLGPNVVRVSASASVPSYLVLDDFYHRGWTATVDGQPTRVFIANALFRAVAIDAGTHVVEFRFQPLSHIVGAAISAISLIVVLGVIAFGGRRRRSL
jgi:hypothetical protein